MGGYLKVQYNNSELWLFIMMIWSRGVELWSKLSVIISTGGGGRTAAGADGFAEIDDNWADIDGNLVDKSDIEGGNFVYNYVCRIVVGNVV